MDYTIKSGDTLSKIAVANNTTVEALARANNIKNVDLIFPGTTLKLSDDKGLVVERTAQAEAPAETAAPVQETASVKPEAPAGPQIISVSYQDRNLFGDISRTELDVAALQAELAPSETAQAKLEAAQAKYDADKALRPPGYTPAELEKIIADSRAIAAEIDTIQTDDVKQKLKIAELQMQNANVRHSAINAQYRGSIITQGDVFRSKIEIDPLFEQLKAARAAAAEVQ